MFFVLDTGLVAFIVVLGPLIVCSGILCFYYRHSDAFNRENRRLYRESGSYLELGQWYITTTKRNNAGRLFTQTEAVEYGPR